MKRLITLILLTVSVIFSNTSLAQSAKMIKLDGTTIVPTTVVTATFSVQKESIRSGPYARFSQKYLGVIAPLTDKDIYTIVDAKLSYANEEVSHKFGSCIAVSSYTNRGTNSIGDFSKVTEDRINNLTTSPEALARDAANRIFSLRKSRLDLITGEAGENVFNEGLKYALLEIDKLEEDILALFIGKHEVTYETRVFRIVPEKGKRTNIIARFSIDGGIVNETDLSGHPVAVNIQVVNDMDVKSDGGKKKSSKDMQEYLVPARSVCQLFNGNDLLIKLDAQIYQLGSKALFPIVEAE